MFKPMPKDLYKATNLSDLDKLAAIIIKKKPAAEIERIMFRCFELATDHRLIDEEVAYILFRRYFDFYEFLKGMNEPSAKSVLADPQFRKQTWLALDYLEQLHKSLKRRYDQLNHETDLPFELPSPPKDFPVEEPAKPLFNLGEKNIASMDDVHSEWISSAELAKLLRKKANLLIFDVRTDDAYAECRLKGENIIHVSLDWLLRDGITFSLLSTKLSQDTTGHLWKSRGDADFIVLMDHSTSTQSTSQPGSCSISPSHPLSIMKNTIYKYDAQHTLKVEPRILDGGLVDFVRRYAPLTTNPNYRVQLDRDHLPVNLPDAGKIDYPHLPADEIPRGDSQNGAKPDTGSDLGSDYDNEFEPPDNHSSTLSSDMDSLTLDERLRELRSKKPESSTRPQIPQPPQFSRSTKPTVSANSSIINLSGPPAQDILDASKKNGSLEAHPQTIPPNNISLPTIPTTIPISPRPTAPDSTSSTLKSISSLPTVLPVENIVYPSCRLRPSGLRNLGNTCYMNAVLHALAHNRALVTFFLRGLDDQYKNVENPLGHGGKFSTHFNRLFTGIWAAEDCNADLIALKQLVGQVNQTFAGYDQQDSLEFLIFFLDALHEDMNEGTKVPCAEQDNLSDEEHLDPETRGNKAWNIYLRNNQSIIVSSFQGQLFSSIRCDTCSKCSSCFDAFMCLSLPLPNCSSCTLQQCLTLFGAPEKIGSSYKCARCKQYTNATKHLTVWKLPPYLIIHLKRFKYNGTSWEKSSNYVNFPMTDFEPQAKGPRYALYAVVNHFGTMESGHYTAFCRGVSDHLWYQYDDNVVTHLPESRIQSSAAYILFYERLPRINVFLSPD